MTQETRGSAAAGTLNRSRSLDRELALSRIGGDLELLQEIACYF